MGKYEEKIKFDKIWGYQNEGIRLQQECQNSNLNHLCWTDDIFRIGKYEGKIKFDKIWRYHNGLYLSNEDAKIRIFLIVEAKHITI